MQPTHRSLKLGYPKPGAQRRARDGGIMTAAKTDKLAGTCSVCLRTMQLHDDRPIRHGFSAVGVKHGQHSGYHTGPCDGTRFDHLGISDEGTRWALDRARQRLDSVNTELVRLAGHPDLTWYRTERRGRPDLSQPVTLRYGEDAGFSTDGRPSYKWEHQQRVDAQERIKTELERAIAAYEKVIATWAPEKYPTTGAAKKVETVHMATPRKNSRGETWTGILCRFSRPGFASDKIAKTDDPGKVTCKRCRSTLGLPAL